MFDSLNPIDYAKKVSHIPQLHLSGKKDTVIPTFIANKFVQKASNSCVTQQIFKNNSHNKGWDKVWENVLNQKIRCN